MKFDIPLYIYPLPERDFISEVDIRYMWSERNKSYQDKVTVHHSYNKKNNTYSKTLMDEGWKKELLK